MKYPVATVVLAVLLVLAVAPACERPQAKAVSASAETNGHTQAKEKTIMSFPSVVAGQFYSDDAAALARQVDAFVADADVPADLGHVFGIIAPHAGYVYSGPVAGHSYRAVKGRQYDVVVVIGVSHRVPGVIQVLDVDVYNTPLGDVPLDRAATRKLAAATDVVEIGQDMFRHEHSLEVQLPFVQRTFPGMPVVMISIGRARRPQLEKLAHALHETFKGRRVLYVASTDLSHFRPDQAARKIDTETLDYLVKCDLDGLYASSELGERMCGLAPVTAVYLAFKEAGGHDARLLAYQNSGDTSGDKGRVVGYGSIALLAPDGDTAAKPAEEGGAATPQSTDEYLTADEKKLLLTIARETVETFVREGRKPDFQIQSARLLADGAAFVTLHKQPDHQLRGCIGQIVAQMPLWECVREMAVAAATQDPRFSRVHEKELSQLTIEISVLTPPEKVKDVNEIKVGEHGLIMSRGWSRGLLLPQVPTEWGWDRDMFLQQTCRKAGLPGDCWRDPETTIERFSALVFAE